MSDLFLHSNTKWRERNRAPYDEVVNAFNEIRDYPSSHCMAGGIGLRNGSSPFPGVSYA